MTVLKKPRKKAHMSQVLGRMASRECLISDRHTESMLVSFLAEADRVESPTDAWLEVRSELAESWGYGSSEGPEKAFIYQDGVAVIPVHGILINRFNWCWGFVTGYDFIRKQMTLANADPDVKLIVFDHDSPGGEAAGCDELAREIKDLDTPTMALVNSLSCSGSFWLAAPCDQIVAAPSASVGSIGVYIQHMNIAKMLAEWGIEIEFIKAGEFKTSGNPYEDMSDADRAYLQQMVDERASEFYRAVAEFRGIEESVVKGTQARVMRPTEAIALGLIDAAESPTTAVSSFVATLSNDNEPNTPEDSQEEVMAEISSEDRAAVEKDTKARIKGIMTHEEAKGREALAEHLAYETDNTVEQAAAIMKFAPKAEAEKPADEGSNADDADADKGKDESEKGKADDADADADKGKDEAKGKSNFEKAMDEGKHPEVGPDGKGDNVLSGDNVDANVARILGAQAAATGRQFDKKGKAA